MNAKYYYYRNEEKQPLITVCLLKLNNEIGKGVAICSNKDFPYKKKGRQIAYARAMKAIGTKKNNDTISMKRARDIIEMAQAFTPKLIFKSEYNPTLSILEQKLIYRKQ